MGHLQDLMFLQLDDAVLHTLKPLLGLDAQALAKADVLSLLPFCSCLRALLNCLAAPQ
jgi:hypothetical protein